ncbi:MAG: hypothetical protein R3F43_17045 [bacterium]
MTLRLLPRREISRRWCSGTPRACPRLRRASPDGAAGGLRPMSVEWFDRASLGQAARHPRLGGAGLGGGGPSRRAAPRQGRGGRRRGGLVRGAAMAAVPPTTIGPSASPATSETLKHLRDSRHAVPESINALARSRGLRKLGTDLAWPAGSLHAMVAYYEAAVADVHQPSGRTGWRPSPPAMATPLPRRSSPPPSATSATTTCT